VDQRVERGELPITLEQSGSSDGDVVAHVRRILGIAGAVRMQAEAQWSARGGSGCRACDRRC
jgi:hypothetical protein